ncbi:MAG: enoyl-CoA hydratase [Rhodospirillales bacterium 69-11]|nr:enoyl-CoA hydratase/isomerase family protein [Rhodospirillales bacterium]MBN8929903.1 enoyl-CoA hydratase/isomerase family protein [Rhodospirillales bacterium]OJW19133.1 MAG: enoyl-CoA hydratase [Rhodospirillales bacterium 69-11]
MIDNLTAVRLQVDGHIALVTMDNPPVNAQSRALSEEMSAVFDWISDTADIRVAVLTGQGRVFCAGADLKRRGDLESAGALPAHSRRTRECFHAIRECAKPVIAAVNGPALGAGLAIVASCDILVASEKASIGLPEIDVGLLGGCRHAMRLFSHSRVRRMLLTGFRVPGEELYRLGVAEACVPQEELMPTAMRLAQEIASKAPLATRMAKHTANTIEDMSLRDGYRYEQDMTASIAKTEDAKEAQRAFAEKRPPVFQGR